LPFPKPSLLPSVLACCLLLSGCGLLLNAGITKLAFGCLPEGTRIDTPSGPVPVEELRTGDPVIGYHGAVTTVRQIHQYQEDPSRTRHLSLTFGNGARVQLSPRHRIGGTPAGQLKAGDRVGNHIVVRVHPLANVSRSFDLLTDDPGYRIQEIPVNSMIEEMAGATFPAATVR